MAFQLVSADLSSQSTNSPGSKGLSSDASLNDLHICTTHITIDQREGADGAVDFIKTSNI